MHGTTGDALAAQDDLTNAQVVQRFNEGITHIGKVIAEVPLKSYAAPFYESKQFPLPALTGNVAPILLLPFHSQRTRALIRADGGKVQVGTIEQLTSLMGFALNPTGSSEEFHTFERIFALNVDTANPAVVSIWAEYALK